MREVANRLYASLIEQQTGMTLDYLPPAQRDIASRAAMEVMIQQKILPVADKMGKVIIDSPPCPPPSHASNLLTPDLVSRTGLIPWPLLHFDKTLSVVQEGSEPYELLGGMADQLETWFLLYLPQQTPSQSQPGASKGPAPVKPKHWCLTYRCISRFAHDLGIVSRLLSEPQLYR